MAVLLAWSSRACRERGKQAASPSPRPPARHARPRRPTRPSPSAPCGRRSPACRADATRSSAFRPALVVKIDNARRRRETAPVRRPASTRPTSSSRRSSRAASPAWSRSSSPQLPTAGRPGPLGPHHRPDAARPARTARCSPGPAATPDVVGAVHASSLRDVGYDAHPAAYSRDQSRQRAAQPVRRRRRAATRRRRRTRTPPQPLFTYRGAGEKLAADRRGRRRACHRLRRWLGRRPVDLDLYDPHVDGWRRGPERHDPRRRQRPGGGARNVVILFTNYAAEPGRRPLARGPDGRVTARRGCSPRAGSSAAPGRRDAADPPLRLHRRCRAHPIKLTPGQDLDRAAPARRRPSLQTELG